VITTSKSDWPIVIFNQEALTLYHIVIFYLSGNAIYLHSDINKALVMPAGAFLLPPVFQQLKPSTNFVRISPK